MNKTDISCYLHVLVNKNELIPHFIKKKGKKLYFEEPFTDLKNYFSYHILRVQNTIQFKQGVFVGMLLRIL